MRPQTHIEQSAGIQMVAAGIFGGGVAMFAFSIMQTLTQTLPNMLLLGVVGIMLILAGVLATLYSDQLASKFGGELTNDNREPHPPPARLVPASERSLVLVDGRRHDDAGVDPEAEAIG